MTYNPGMLFMLGKWCCTPHPTTRVGLQSFSTHRSSATEGQRRLIKLSCPLCTKSCFLVTCYNPYNRKTASRTVGSIPQRGKICSQRKGCYLVHYSGTAQHFVLFLLGKTARDEECLTLSGMDSSSCTGMGGLQVISCTGNNLKR